MWDTFGQPSLACKKKNNSCWQSHLPAICLLYDLGIWLAGMVQFCHQFKGKAHPRILLKHHAWKDPCAFPSTWQHTESLHDHHCRTKELNAQDELVGHPQWANESLPLHLYTWNSDHINHIMIYHLFLWNHHLHLVGLSMTSWAENLCPGCLGLPAFVHAVGLSITIWSWKLVSMLSGTACICRKQVAEKKKPMVKF